MTLQKKILVGFGLVILVGISVWAYRDAHRPSASSSSMTKEAGDWVKGPENAPVTLLEYTDFQCPACGSYYPLVTRLSNEYSEKMALVIRHYPLIQIHKNALAGARAAEAAGRQGKFWEMYDTLFSKQSEWSGEADPTEKFLSYAEALSLNKDTFAADLRDGSLDEHINKGLSEGNDAGVQGTPSFFLNGKKIDNPNSYEDFKKLIDDALGSAPKEPSPSPETPTVGEEVHEHADFKVYILGKAFDFTQEKYQSTEGKELNPALHLHDGNGNVIHKHKSGVTLGEFFQSLKMELTKGCLRLDTGEAYCSGPVNTLKVWVNGAPSEKFDTLEFHDGDRILISYGSEDSKALQAQMDSVTHDACIYSEKCPERGKPPTESCVGGLGSDCKE